MGNGLLDPIIVSFVFTPLAVTTVLLLSIWWKQITSIRAAMPTLDMPGLVLASVIRRMPEAQRDWERAMLAELGEIQSHRARWRFALDCVRVALFLPYGESGLMKTIPVCGLLAVALPPLGLPFIYFMSVFVEAIGGSPLTQSSSWSNPDAAIEVVQVILKLMLLCLLAGLPLGLAGLLRRERMRWLSVMGMLLSTGIVSYFVMVMSLIAAGPHGD